MTTETSKQAVSEAESTRSLLSDWAGKRAATLQREYMEDDASAVATLARLRRAMSGEGRINSQVWDVFDGMPASLIWERDEPSPAEQAAIVALTLFATHQQSRRDKAMHRSGYTHHLGQAVATLHRGASSKGVSTRFRALTRASDLTSVLPHLRSLITQLSSERIPVDYGALAKDLYDLQYPGGMDDVRMRWIRAFHAPVRPRPDSQPTDAETITTPTNSGADA